MQYLSTDLDESGQLAPRGELYVRAPNISSGYYKSEKQMLNSSGWLATGDVAVRLPINGAIRILDRKKNFVKLSHGEFVALQAIESVLK